jgi:hypothetical protein
MSKGDEYLTPAATWSAIRDAARNGSAAKGLSVSDMQGLLLFDRFLARVFAVPDGAFVLKGGTRMLAFIPTARATVDIDLETSRYDVNAAVAHLEQLVGEDIGDRLRFTLQKQDQRVASGDQPNISMVSLTFQAVGIGQTIKIDLAVHNRAGVATVRADPEFRVPLGREVASPEYVMISTEEQIADKIAAMMERNHGGDGRSSRAKDLVDLAILAEHSSCDADLLRRALLVQMEQRSLTPFTRVDASPVIQSGYARVAKRVAMLTLTWQEAEALTNLLIEPILEGTVVTGTWDQVEGRWRTE